MLDLPHFKQILIVAMLDDSPKRELDVYDSEGLPAASLEDEESASNESNLSESEAISNRSNPMENPKPSRKPRREVWWLDLGTTNQSLKSIGRCFEDRLNWSLLSSSNSLLRRIRSPKDDNLRRNVHRCPGYLREEITLTCDLSKSVIVSHAFPGLSERCSVCHQLVRYTTPFDYDHCPSPMISGSLSPQPTEISLSFDPFVPNNMVTSSDAPNASDMMALMDELFQASLPFDEDTLPTLRPMSDPNVWQDISLPGIFCPILIFIHITEFTPDCRISVDGPNCCPIPTDTATTIWQVGQSL